MAMHAPDTSRWIPSELTCRSVHVRFRDVRFHDLSDTSYLMTITPSRPPEGRAGLVMPLAALPDLRDAIAMCPAHVIKHVDFLDYPRGAPAAWRDGNFLQCGLLSLHLSAIDACVIVPPTYRNAMEKRPALPYECLGHLGRVLQLL